jgi:signal transduction histidine kinase
MTAVHRATEGLSPRPAEADGRDPDRLLDGGRLLWQLLRPREGRDTTYVDLALATVIFAISTWWVLQEGAPMVDLFFSAAIASPLILRRRSPVAVFFMIAIVALTQWILTGPLPSDVALLVAIYTVAAASPWLWVLVCAAVLEAGVVMATVRWRPTGSELKSLVYLTALAFTALLTGMVVRAVRSQFDWLAERAERLERERDQLASLAAAEERARIAREMHDVVSHNIQVMVTLADGAAAAARTDPARAADVMGEVSGTGREALTDMRRMLGVLRERTAPAPPAARAPAARAPAARPTATKQSATRSSTTKQSATGIDSSLQPQNVPASGRPGTTRPLAAQTRNGGIGSAAQSPTHRRTTDERSRYAPQPGLADLDALVDRVRATGLHVEVERSGRSFELSAAAELTVYRLVQEALTNALKHADSPSSVDVLLRFDDPDVSVRVIDDGRVSALATGYALPTRMTVAMESGHGLSGMAERAAAFGGSLEAGPLSGSGWCISATLRHCRSSPVP